MKTEVKKVQPVSESRKIRKPLMEKKRRARINDSLETLKQILLESKTTLKESCGKKSGQRTAKLEKADILEMTVRYLQHLHNKLNDTSSTNASCDSAKLIKEEIRIRPADSSSCNNVNNNYCDNNQIKMGVTLIPTKLSSGELVFVVPNLKANFSADVKGSKDISIQDNVWRPW